MPTRPAPKAVPQAARLGQKPPPATPAPKTKAFNAFNPRPQPSSAKPSQAAASVKLERGVKIERGRSRSPHRPANAPPVQKGPLPRGWSEHFDANHGLPY